MSRKTAKSICISIAALCIAASVSACGPVYTAGGGPNYAPGQSPAAGPMPTVMSTPVSPYGRNPSAQSGSPGFGANSSMPGSPGVSLRPGAIMKKTPMPQSKQRRFQPLQATAPVFAPGHMDATVPADNSLIVGKWRGARGDIIEFRDSGEVLKSGRISFFEVVNSKKVNIFENYYTKAGSHEYAISRDGGVLVFGGARYTQM